MPAVSSELPPPPLPGTFRAFRHRSFLLYWTGQLVSLVGTWMQSVAQGWLVLRLTDSPFHLGLVGFCAFVPVLLFTLLGGMVADRLPRRSVLLWTQSLSMVQATVLTLLTWLGVIRVWEVALLAFGLGTVNAFDIPIRQSFLYELVGRDDLPNAVALNSMAFNGARLVGPAVAGLVLAAFGEEACFLINALSFLAVLICLALIRDTEAPAAPADGPWLSGIREGLTYAWSTQHVRLILFLVAVTSVFGMPYSILMPSTARDVLGGDQRTLGFLMGSAGAGAVLGALAVAARRSQRNSSRYVAGAMTLFGASLVAFSFSRSFGFSAAILVLVGGAMIVQLATSNATVQLAAPEPLRGRIVSVYTLMFVGMAPVGALLAGLLARFLGTPRTVGLCGAVCLATALWYASRLPSRAARGGSGRLGPAPPLPRDRT